MASRPPDSSEPAEQLPQPAGLEEPMDTKAATQSETLSVAHGNALTPPEEVDPQLAEESQAPGEASVAGDVCMDVGTAGDPWTEDRRAPPAGLGDGSEDSDRYGLFHTSFLPYGVIVIRKKRIFNQLCINSILLRFLYDFI